MGARKITAEKNISNSRPRRSVASGKSSNKNTLTKPRQVRKKEKTGQQPVESVCKANSRATTESLNSVGQVSQTDVRANKRREGSDNVQIPNKKWQQSSETLQSCVSTRSAGQSRKFRERNPPAISKKVLITRKQSRQEKSEINRKQIGNESSDIRSKKSTMRRTQIRNMDKTAGFKKPSKVTQTSTRETLTTCDRFPALEEQEGKSSKDSHHQNPPIQTRTTMDQKRAVLEDSHRLLDESKALIAEDRSLAEESQALLVESQALCVESMIIAAESETLQAQGFHVESRIAFKESQAILKESKAAMRESKAVMRERRAILRETQQILKQTKVVLGQAYLDPVRIHQSDSPV